jgi:hypothetical protein
MVVVVLMVAVQGGFLVLGREVAVAQILQYRGAMVDLAVAVEWHQIVLAAMVGLVVVALVAIMAVLAVLAVAVGRLALLGLMAVQVVKVMRFFITQKDIKNEIRMD